MSESPGRVEQVTSILVLPTGMSIDDEERHTFGLTVQWRGPYTDTGRGGWAVIASGDRHLSHQGDWRWTPEPFLQRHYRWETKEDALLAAHAWVDRRKVNGRTWAEWHAAQILDVADGEAHE